jgi:hypothetical protein
MTAGLSIFLSHYNTIFFFSFLAHSKTKKKNHVNRTASPLFLSLALNIKTKKNWSLSYALLRLAHSNIGGNSRPVIIGREMVIEHQSALGKRETEEPVWYPIIYKQVTEHSELEPFIHFLET